MRQDILHVPVGQLGRPIRFERPANRIDGHELARIGCESDDVEGPVHDERVRSLPRVHVGPRVALPLVRPIIVIVPAQCKGHRGGLAFSRPLAPAHRHRGAVESEVVARVLARRVPLPRPRLACDSPGR